QTAGASTWRIHSRNSAVSWPGRARRRTTTITLMSNLPVRRAGARHEQTGGGEASAHHADSIDRERSPPPGPATPAVFRGGRGGARRWPATPAVFRVGRGGAKVAGVTTVDQVPGCCWTTAWPCCAETPRQPIGTATLPLSEGPPVTAPAVVSRDGGKSGTSK